MVKVKELKDHPKNRNKHGSDQIERLAEIYKFQGIRHPIIVSKKSGHIVAGHGRKLAAVRAGLLEMPVVYQDFESDAQEYAFIQSDNAIALWADLDIQGIKTDALELGDDFDFKMIGLKDFELEPEKEFQSDPDEVPEVVEPKAKLGQIYKLGEHRLMCGDSTDQKTVEKLMNGEKADMVFTDPPYGIGIDGQKQSSNKNPKHNRKSHEFRGWDSERPSKELFDLILTQKIPTIIFGGNYFADLLPPSRGWIYWNKGQDGLTMSDGELAWTNQDKPLRAVTVNRAELKGSVHPTQKPISVVEFCLKYINESKSVIDLFGGSGSTLIACEKTNRKCFMMELDPKFVDTIIARWEKFTGKKAELLNAK
ncbi:DNA methylase N-4/N-6 [uncultured Caudovirales phage]|uniref:DNA methylase N-4/N-6 n=1 Tax=uncultured Caudovirales phage TaxID=2100421 RepID=A0A6J5N0T1_9CAUD|nr:DNA methylase N-4/N-6 [uncultured Caudovirales phage]